MSRSRRGARGKKQATRPEVSTAFWGTEIDEELAPIRVSEDPSAMVRSLGAPPLKGHEVAAEYTFRLVYDKAVGLATTLAAAAELDGNGNGNGEAPTEMPASDG